VTPLATRQREVLDLVAAGYTNPSIAQMPKIDLGTVKKHIQAIVEKLGATNRSHAVAVALRTGVL
jgi:DNA-binding NarL/FixJ family response regulator